MERWNHLTTPSIARVFHCFWSPPPFLYVKKEELGIGCLSSVYTDSDLKYKFAVFFRSSKYARNLSSVANVRPVFKKQRLYLLFSSFFFLMIELYKSYKLKNFFGSVPHYTTLSDFLALLGHRVTSLFPFDGLGQDF